MVFNENISHVRNFPKEYSLTGAEQVNTGVIGSIDFAIVDTVMIIHTMVKDAAWKVLSLNDMDLLREFVTLGNGPQEFLSIPWPSQCEFFRQGGDICCLMGDMSKRRMCSLNLSKSLDEGKLALDVVLEDLPYPCFTMFYIDSNALFYRTISPDMSRQDRFLREGGSDMVPSGLEELNAAHVEPGKDYNLLSSHMKYVRDKNLIVEVPVALTDINIYSLDGQYSRSICLRDKPSDIDALQQLSPADIPFTFSALRTYGDYFAVLYIGETAMTYETGRKNLPHVYVFDYEGNPKADIALDKQVTSFDFDMEHGFLYAFDLITEQMYRYRLPGNFILESM